MIEFKEGTKNKILTNHVIRRDQLPDKDICELRCYLEPNCVSYNYGPLSDGTFTCELNGRTYLQVPGSLEDKSGFVYTEIFCKYGLVTFSFTKVISLRVKKLGYSVVPFDVIYLSIHHVLIDLLYRLIYFLLIFQNSCESIPCAHHATCQAGFGNLDIREFSAKQVREKTSNDKMMSSDSSIFN